MSSSFQKLFSFFLLIIFISSCTDKKVEIGSKERPLKMFFIPSVDAEELNRSGSEMEAFVEKYVSQKLYGKDTGFYVKTAVPTSYVAVVEAFGTKKADFATLTTFAYILAKDIKKYNIDAVLRVVRGDGESTYKSQIVARADSQIKSLNDLNGKKIAFTDPASTSGYILPTKLLNEKNIKPKEVVFAQKHDNVITMIYQGQVDAGATYYSSPKKTIIDGKEVLEIMDARARVKTQFPDVEDKVKIIAFTEDIPNEPWVIRSDLYDDPEKNEKMKNLIVEAVEAFVQTEQGKLALKQIAAGTSLVKSDDKVYQGIRKTILSSNLDLEGIISEGKK